MSHETANQPDLSLEHPLVRVIYVSGATVPFSEDDFSELMSGAREKNARLGISGILLFREGSFLQVLEGPSVAVDWLFETIQRDPRHSRLLVVQRSEIQQREFADQPMAFLSISPETCVAAPFSDPSLQRLFRDFCAEKWRRAFDCHRKENAGIPICNPYLNAMWGNGESAVQDDQTNIQVEISHSPTAQNNGGIR
ncbi:MAG: BLUF domain-containing protein [Planctomycetaceae bacterium]|nr:BLUF domain-containing protein [Planctomycetaceae bacterium]